MSHLRWGILAASRIARRFVGDLQSHGIEVLAVGSRREETAARFAAEFGINRACGSYTALLADQDIDAVYISVPNHLHAEWSIRAAQAGKHILCEKPAVLKEREWQAVLSAVRRADVFYMEAFMYRCHPIWDEVKRLIASGGIGPVRMLHSAFSFDMGVDLTDIRQSNPAGGGALMDVGCYCLSFSRLAAGEEPDLLRAVGQVGAASRVDEWSCAALHFPSGISATFNTGIRVNASTQAVIFGETGRIEIPAPWFPPPLGAEIHLYRDDEERQVLTVGDGLSLYAREALQVAEHIDARQCPAMSWQDSLGQVRAMDALRGSLGLRFDRE